MALSPHPFSLRADASFRCEDLDYHAAVLRTDLVLFGATGLSFP
jgi:hypothetical protein